MQDKAYKTLPQQKAYTENYIEKLQADIDRVQSVKPLENEDGKKYYPIKVGDKEYHDKEKAGEAIREAIRSNKDIYAGKERYIGSYRGFEMYAFADSLGMYGERVAMKINLKGACDHYGELNMNSDVNAGGNIIRLDNIINGIEIEKQKQEERLANLCADIEEAKAAAEAVFPQEQELTEKEQRLAEVNTLLSQSDISDGSDEAERSDEEIDYEEPEEDMEEEKVTSGWER